jgi:hypothetical protein
MFEDGEGMIDLDDGVIGFVRLSIKLMTLDCPYVPIGAFSLLTITPCPRSNASLLAIGEAA